MRIYSFASIVCFLLSSASLFQCSATGPPFAAAPPGDDIPLSGAYSFRPPLPFYTDSLAGEVIFDFNPSRREKTVFDMRISGVTNEGIIEERSYSGAVRRFENMIELRSERCYLFRRRTEESRRFPQERWDCDHLYFHFESENDFTEPGVLKGVSHKRGRFSSWMGLFDLHPKK